MIKQTTQEISTGYVPRPLQALLHRQLKRFNVIVCHRRFGKTVFALNEKIDRALRNPLKNPQYAYFAPYYGQAKRVAWDYLKEYTSVFPGVNPNESDLRVEIPRPARNDKIRFMLLGADNPGAVRGIYLDGVTLDEYAEMDPQVWSKVVRPTLSDRGGWANFIGTPKGQNHFSDLYQKAVLNPEWFAALYRASETGIISPGELESARESMSEDEYDQEYECSFTAALIGAYWGKEMDKAEKEKRIGKVPYDASVPVDTYWDLGMDDTTSIWFMQQVGREHHAIDYLEDNGKGLEFYARELQRKPYVYREHQLPHDAAARELGTGKTRQEMLSTFGVRGKIQVKHEIEDGIQAVRSILPKVWFDGLKCERGISALKNYERKWDAKNKIFAGRPLHNWASNGADAFRLFAMGYRDNYKRDALRNLPTRTVSEYDLFS